MKDDEGTSGKKGVASSRRRQRRGGLSLHFWGGGATITVSPGARTSIRAHPPPTGPSQAARFALDATDWLDRFGSAVEGARGGRACLEKKHTPLCLLALQRNKKATQSVPGARARAAQGGQ
jgi:hypothetical protein